MRALIAIYRRELAYYFQSITAYVVIAIFLLISGYFFFSIFRYYNYLSLQHLQSASPADGLNLIDGVMRPLLGNISILILLLLPLLTMRLLAEERKQGTFELLLTYPVSDAAAVGGKFLAALSVYAVMLAGTLAYPVMLAVFADPEIPPIASGYLGVFLMGASFIAMGTFFSSLTGNQIVAGVSTLGAALFFLIIGWAAPFVGTGFAAVLAQISLLYHFESFSKGVIDTQDVSYYVLLAGFFLFMTVRSLESARWRG
ncbi:MAG: ABC transporter permease [Candidatus Krumholzibacteria bacterium]|nr:ABC transporter permease [Candidatus Krumholzibacteria bacterium]